MTYAVVENAHKICNNAYVINVAWICTYDSEIKRDYDVVNNKS